MVILFCYKEKASPISSQKWCLSQKICRMCDSCFRAGNNPFATVIRDGLRYCGSPGHMVGFHLLEVWRGHVTFPAQWNMRRRNMCHFSVQILRTSTPLTIFLIFPWPVRCWLGLYSSEGLSGWMSQGAYSHVWQLILAVKWEHSQDFQPECLHVGSPYGLG